MSRYFFDKKTEADSLLSIDIKLLKTKQFLNGYKYGDITWTRGDNYKNSTRIITDTNNKHPYIRLQYTQTDKDTEENKYFDYQVPFVKTACNFGGHRYWFICPLYKDGVYCGRRVGVLYKDGDYFGCRHCYNLTYESRNLSNSGHHHYFRKFFDTEEKIEKLEQSIKKRFYRGKLTRKQTKLDKLQDKRYIAVTAINSIKDYN